MATEMGFYPKDLFILLAKHRINSFGSKWSKQEHARKHHSYFWIFQKVRPKVDYKIKQDFVETQDTSSPDPQPSILKQSPQEIQ